MPLSTNVHVHLLTVSMSACPPAWKAVKERSPTPARELPQKVSESFGGEGRPRRNRRAACFGLAYRLRVARIAQRDGQLRRRQLRRQRLWLRRGAAAARVWLRRGQVDDALLPFPSLVPLRGRRGGRRRRRSVVRLHAARPACSHVVLHALPAPRHLTLKFFDSEHARTSYAPCAAFNASSRPTSSNQRGSLG